MKKTFYLFNPGRLSRQDNTLKYTAYDEAGAEGQTRFLPIEDVADLYVFGSLDANSALYNFLGKNGVSVHFFDYYEHYTGSFMAKEYLLAGRLQVAQTGHYTSLKKRLVLARKLVEGAAFNLLKNLRYYQSRGRVVGEEIAQSCPASKSPRPHPASIGPGGIEIPIPRLRQRSTQLASIGPGGIEIYVSGRALGIQEELQSDQVELKLAGVVGVIEVLPRFNRTRWN